MLLAIYLLTGAITGIAAGLLGVGGGLIVVPALVAIFHVSDPGNPYLMQIAIGTSLSTIIPTSISSLVAHYRRGAVAIPDAMRLAPGLAIGALAGAWLASRIDTHSLKIGYGLFVIVVSIQMLAGFRPGHANQGRTNVLIGALIGIISAMTGIGGGSMTVPYLVWKGRDMRSAIGTSAACGLPIALAATLGFVATGLGKVSDLSGFIHVPAFVSIAAASIVTAPLGAKLAHTLPAPHIKRVFAIFLLIVGVKMLIG